MARIRFNRNFNVNTVVKSLVKTILALYVGGTIMTVFGNVMANTTSAFYSGLSLMLKFLLNLNLAIILIS